VRGWTITPTHFLNNQLDTVWLAESRAKRGAHLDHSLSAEAPGRPYLPRPRAGKFDPSARREPRNITPYTSYTVVSSAPNCLDLPTRETVVRNANSAASAWHV